MRKRIFTKDDEERIINSYKDLSLLKISKEYNCDPCVIKRILKEKKVLIKKNKGYIKGKTWDEYYGKEKAEELKKKLSMRTIKRNLENNPMKNPEIREKSRNSIKIGFEKGRKIWSTGLTKETDERIKNYADKLKGREINIDWRKKLSESHIGKKLSEETKKKLKITAKRNIEKLWKNPEYIEKQKKAGINLWKNEKYKNKQLKLMFESRDKRPTKPEIFLKEIIEKNNLPFNYVGDGKIWFRGETMAFNPDFLSKNPKHIIEVFGDYWHNRIDMKKRDEERLKTYQKYGYKTLIVWGHELVGNSYGNKLSEQEIIIKINKLINI